MPETEEEKAVWANAMKRAQDPKWNRWWFETQLPLHMAAATAAYDALTDTQKAEFSRRHSEGA